MSSSQERAMRAGVIPPLDFSPGFTRWSPSRIEPQTQRALARVKRPTPINWETRTEQLDDPARDTKAQLYQDKGFVWTGPNGADPFVDGNVLELARFIATPGQVGVVKYCGTYVEVESAVAPGYVQLDPRDPFGPARAGVEIRWLLRLYQGTFESLGPKWSGPINECFGYGFGELPYWDDYRFQWGRTANDVWWLVPENHALRLYGWIVSGSGDIGRMLGRLVGFTQPIRTIQAGWNVRQGW